MGADSSVRISDAESFVTSSVSMREGLRQCHLKRSSRLAPTICLGGCFDRLKQFCQDGLGFLVARLKSIDGANDCVDRAGSHFREKTANLGSHGSEITFDHLRFAGKAHPESFVLRGDAHRARIQMALTSHNTPQRQQSSRAETEFIGSQQRTDDDISSELESAVHAQSNPATQTLAHQGTVSIA